MNGQPKRPESWKEWHELLTKTLKDLEMQIELVKAQLEVAKRNK